MTAGEEGQWREVLRPYAQPRLGRSLLDIATSVVPYLGLCVAMYLLLDVSFWLTLALAPLAAGFLVRVYILFHDCTHGSFMPTKRANTWLGSALGLLVFSPFLSWRHNHQVHHATAGDLDRRGVGDVPTWTVAEYNAAPRKKQIEYRLTRNPLIMFTIGPILSMIVLPRIVSKNDRPRIRRAVIWTNVALAVMVTSICLLIGWQAYLLVQVPTLLLAGAAGVFLFYVQHQFEDVYWESSERWDYDTAALQGQLLLQAAEGAPVLLGQHRPAPRAPPERPHPQLQPPAGARRQPDLPQRPHAHPPGGAANGAAEAVGREPRPAGHLGRGRDQRRPQSPRRS